MRAAEMSKVGHSQRRRTRLLDRIYCRVNEKTVAGPSHEKGSCVTGVATLPGAEAARPTIPCQTRPDCAMRVEDCRMGTKGWFAKLDWLGDDVMRDLRHFKSNLAAYPFVRW